MTVKAGTATEYAASLKWEQSDELKEEGVKSFNHLVLRGVRLMGDWHSPAQSVAHVVESSDREDNFPFHARVFTYEENEEGICRNFSTLEEAKAFVEKQLRLDE